MKYFNKIRVNSFRLTAFLLILLVLGMYIPSFQNSILDSQKSNSTHSEEILARLSETDYYSTEWIKYGNFSAGHESYWDSVTSGDAADFNLAVSGGAATYKVMGEQRSFSLSESPIVGSNWLAVQNPDIPYLPDNVYSDSEGLKVYHQFTDNGDANQIPSAHWDRNFTMPVDMSDYVITTASIETVVNATVSEDVDVYSDYLNGYFATNGGAPINQIQSFDYVRFYVLLSDLSKDKTYELGYYQPPDLGAGNPPGTDTLTDTNLITVSEEVLIFYLTSVLSSDNYNFTVTIGIRIYCADSSTTYDTDTFTELLIKTINLSFTYEKKINQLNSGSWRQDAETIPSNYIIENATLNFKYKIDKDWTTNTGSLNSEFRIIINTNQLGQTVKLTTATGTYQDFKVGGLDVSSFISPDQDVNVSIQVYIGDQFNLDTEITISIDDVSLVIGYGIYTPPDETDFELILNNIDKTTEKSTQVTFNKNLNVSLVYKDSLGDFIPDANVQLTGDGMSPITLLPNAFETYYTIISSTDLGVGMTYLTLTASKRYYTTIQFQISIEVIPRDTELQLFLDNTNQTVNKEWTTFWNQNLNITIKFHDIDSSPATHVSGAIVELTGLSATKTLIEDQTNEQYEITINTYNLGIGSTFLTVYASKSNYTSLNIRFKVTVTTRLTYLDNLELDEIERTSMEMAWNELIDISVSYNDTDTDDFINGATVELIGPNYLKSLSFSGQSYTTSINTFDLSIGNNFLTILAQKDNYSMASQLITIVVEERATIIESILNHTSTTTINYPHGELLNITAIYSEPSLSFISGAMVQLRAGSSVIYNLTQSLIFDHYSVVINTNELSLGSNLLTLHAKLDNYSMAFASVTITVEERDTSLEVYLDETPTTVIELAYGEFLNITVMYEDQTGYFIDDATVELRVGTNVWASFSKHSSFEQYFLTIDCATLNLGSNIFNIYAQKDNYSAALTSISVIVIERETLIEIYLEETFTTSIETIYGDFINITAIYKDYMDLFIDGATVELRDGTTTLNILSKHAILNQYYIIKDSKELNLGSNVLSVYAKKENYSVSLITILIVVEERDTTLDVLINEINSDTFEYYSVSINNSLNITAIYNDFEDLFVSGAIVELTGSGISETLIQDMIHDQYVYNLNVETLGVGVHFLVISAEKENYTTAITNIKINVLERGSNLQLFVNGENITSSRYVASEIYQSLNVTVCFTDSSDDSHISNANIKLSGALNDNFTENSFLEHYNYSINTVDLHQGINFLTIFAQKQDYISQSIVFTIEVIEKASNLQLFLNNNNKTLDKSIEITVGEFINITVIYEDYAKNFIENAEVIIVGEGIALNLTKHPLYDQYNVSIDSLDLNFGINLLTLYAKRANYQPQTLIVRIEIIEKETSMQVFLNGLNKSIDKTITLPIRSLLNVTVKYTGKQKGEYITGATIQLLGEGLNNTLTYDPVHKQYSCTIDTLQLDIGVRFLTIYAQRANYQSYSVLLRIQVERIHTNITTVSGKTVINRQPGQDYELEIELFDLDFNTHVLDATVTYTWTFGQGSLTDPDGDGIYKGTISDLREGTFEITISVYAGDDYEFERFTVTINVIRPPEDVLLFQVLTVVGVGAAIALGGYLLAYQRVLKYPKQVRNIRKFRSKLEKKKSIGIEIRLRDQIVEEKYAEKLHPLEKQIKSRISTLVQEGIIEQSQD